MARVALIDLLAERRIGHPTTVTSIAIADRAMRVLVAGYPWWKKHPEPNDRSSIELIFEGIECGNLCFEDLAVDRYDEALERLDVRRRASVDWLQPAVFSIYCSGAIPRPLELYARIHDYLVLAGAGGLVGPDAFLNGAEQIHKFIEMVSSSSFLVAQGPERIRDIVCGELERQMVAHNVIRAMTPTASQEGLLVVLANSAFVCQAATAEFTT